MFHPDLPPNESLWERLSEVVQADDERTFRRLIAANRPDIRGYCLWELVREAAEVGRVWAIEALLEICTEQEIEDMNEAGCDPLTAAAWHGHEAIVRRLLAAGADPDAARGEFGSLGRSKKSGRCALYCAMIGGHQNLVALLEPITSPAMRSMAHAAVELHRSF